MRKFLITLLLITLVAFIGARASGPQGDRQPAMQKQLVESQHRLDELLTILEAELDLRRDSRDHNLRRLATRARGDR